MKVFLQSEGKKLTIILPTAIVLNRFTATIAAKIIKRKQPSMDISVEDLMKLIHCIKKYKQSHKNWEVVNISSANEERVFLKL